MIKKLIVLVALTTFAMAQISNVLAIVQGGVYTPIPNTSAAATTNPNANLKVGDKMTVVTTTDGQRADDESGKNKASAGDGSIPHVESVGSDLNPVKNGVNGYSTLPSDGTNTKTKKTKKSKETTNSGLVEGGSLLSFGLKD